MEAGAAAASRTGSVDVQRWAAAAILAAAAGVYLAIGVFTIVFGRTWSDEVTYVAKSWWYVHGQVAPYSDIDATLYMPLYFYQLGLIQLIFGKGLTVARTASLVLGGCSGALLVAIVRRVTGNTVAAALAALLYLATPATAYYFATATPFASVSCVLLVAVWLIVDARERPDAFKSFLLGVTLAALFFYRQNMIAAIAILAPVHVVLMRTARIRHTSLMVAGALCICASMALLFPAKLWLYAIRLPLITGALRGLGLIGGNTATILDYTQTPLSLEFAPDALLLHDIAGMFLLPYLGTVLLALAALPVVKGRERWWLLFPALFMFLSAVHYVGSAGYCRNCIVAYTNYYVGVGALSAGLVVALAWRKRGVLAAAAIIAFALALNVAASALIPQGSPLRLFPAEVLRQDRSPRESVDMERLARVIADTTPTGKPVVVIHNLPSLTYATFSAGRVVQTQSLNIWQSYRDFRPGLSDPERATVTRALEAESLWSEDSLARWIERDADVIVYQEAVPAGATQAALDQYFDLKTRADYRGWNVGIYTRKPEAPDAIPVNGHALVCELPFLRPGMPPC